ncbi:MAG: phage holin family protein [Methanothrix sp.]
MNQILGERGPETFKLLLAGVGTGGIYLFGAWDVILKALIALVVIDYITGVMAAYVEKTLSSEIGMKGIIKKVCIFLMVAVANIMDISSGLDEPYLRTAVIWFFIANEGLSALENMGRLGVPLPEFLKQSLQKLNKGNAGR